MPDALESFTETTVYIPYNGPDDADGTNNAGALHVDLFTSDELAERDLSGGPGLRLLAYDAAWKKCVTRMQEIIHKLHAPITAEVVQTVENAYGTPNPLMPFTELPTIAISGPDRAATLALFDDIESELTATASHESDDGSAMSTDGASNSQDRPPTAYVVSMSPADCPNLMAAMKTMITGFVDNPPNDSEEPKGRKTATSLASYDINLLEAWYDAVVEFRGRAFAPKLVVLLHDFEQFDHTLVQDLFYICSLHIPRLPLIFVLALSSPPHPSYLHTAYPRSTLALLRLHRHSMLGGSDALQSLLLKTFFDVDFEPHIMLGPSTLDFVAEQYMRHNMSIDFVTTLLQLIHLQHFMEPLTVFATDELLGMKTVSQAADKLKQEESKPFLDSLHTRFHHSENPNSESNATSNGDLPEVDIKSILSSVGNARMKNMSKAKKTRLAFAIFRVVQGFLVKEGYKTAENTRSCFDVMSGCLRGNLSRKEGKYVAMMVKKASAVQLSALLAELHKFLHEQSVEIRRDEGETRLKIVTLIAQIPRDDAMDEWDVTGTAAAVGDWLSEFFSERMPGYSDERMWDLWYTGQASMLTELINPAPRATTMAGLIHPERYIEYGSQAITDANLPQHLPVPDLTFLFQGYLESGRMINVYDWYESFTGSLEAENRRIRSSASGDSELTSNRSGPSPRKAKGKGKGKSKAVEDETENDEEWALEVQARFIRTIHELDYMGFIKHTGRKADHVVKTVFDLPDS